MAARTELTTVAATCLECGSVSAANARSDGTVRPIGRPAGRLCGSSEFRIV